MMAEKEKKEAVTIDVNQVYALMNAIKEELEGLQVVHAQLSDLYERVRRAKESIDAIALSEGTESFLMPLEPGALVLTEMKPVSRDEFIINIGLDVYVKMNASDAQRILSARESEILKRLEEVRARMGELSRAYEQYQAVLQAAVMQAQARAMRGSGGAGGL
jgi:prefoldin alpha subunit